MNTRQNRSTPVKQGYGVFGGTGQLGNYAQQQQQQQKPADVKPFGAGGGATQAAPAAATDANGKKPKPEWQLKKANPELRRLRQNARVKKVVKPKTAIMVLHEMYPDVVYKIDEVASNKTSIYRVHFELDKKQYAGEGFSKTQAKQSACENALKAMLLERFAKEQEAEKAAASEKAAAGGDKGGANSMETDETENKIPTDDFPWGKLAGFAMQKLMDLWTEKAAEPTSARPFTPVVGGGIGPYGGHQTFSHPNHLSFSNYSAGPQQVFSSDAAGFQAINKAETKVRRSPAAPSKKFPENPLEYNAVALCNQTWPNMEPVFESSRNAEGQPVHTATLTLEGFKFSALGKSKKEVKLQLSKAVISKLKGVQYPDGYTAQVIQV